MLSSPNSSISELHVCKLNILSPSHPLPPLLFISPLLSPICPSTTKSLIHWYLEDIFFLGQVSQKHVQMFKMWYILWIWHFYCIFPQKLIQFYCWRKLSFCFTKKNFAVKMATFLPRAKWWLANPLQKKTETWHEVIIFTWAAYSSFHFFFFLTEVNFISSRIKQFLG